MGCSKDKNEYEDIILINIYENSLNKVSNRRYSIILLLP
jgi:hypothetical protein